VLASPRHLSASQVKAQLAVHPAQLDDLLGRTPVGVPARQGGQLLAKQRDVVDTHPRPSATGISRTCWGTCHLLAGAAASLRGPAGAASIVGGNDHPVHSNQPWR